MSDQGSIGRYEAHVGRSFPSFTIEVERGKIAEFARAIGDLNPIYYSKEAAQAAGYADVPLFPSFPTALAFWGNPQKSQYITDMGIELKNVLHGEEAYTYLGPIASGDTLTGVTTLIEVKSTQTKSGTTMDILTFEIRYTNQHNVPVLTSREVVIARG